MSLVYRLLRGIFLSYRRLGRKRLSVFLLVVFQQILCIEFCQAARNFSNERPGQAVFSDAKSRVRCQQLPLVEILFVDFWHFEFYECFHKATTGTGTKRSGRALCDWLLQRARGSRKTTQRERVLHRKRGTPKGKRDFSVSDKIAQFFLRVCFRKI